MEISKKIKASFVFAIAILFANNVQAQDAKATNYDQGFKLGIGINAGYVFSNCTLAP